MVEGDITRGSGTKLLSKGMEHLKALVEGDGTNLWGLCEIKGKASKIGKEPSDE